MEKQTPNSNTEGRGIMAFPSTENNTVSGTRTVGMDSVEDPRTTEFPHGTHDTTQPDDNDSDLDEPPSPCSCVAGEPRRLNEREEHFSDSVGRLFQPRTYPMLLTKSTKQDESTKQDGCQPPGSVQVPGEEDLTERLKEIFKTDPAIQGEWIPKLVEIAGQRVSASQIITQLDLLRQRPRSVYQERLSEEKRHPVSGQVCYQRVDDKIVYWSSKCLTKGGGDVFKAFFEDKKLADELAKYYVDLSRDPYYEN